MPVTARSISIPATPFTALLGEQSLPFGGTLPAISPAECLGVRHLIVSAGLDQPGFSQRHQHDAWVLVGTLAGQAAVVVEEWQATVTAGTLFLIPPGLPFHENLLGTHPWLWVVALIYTDVDAPCTAALPRAPFTFQVDACALTPLITLLQSLHRQDPGDAMIALGMLLTLFGACWRAAEAYHPPHAAEGVSAEVAAAMAYLRAHLEAAPSLAEIAAACHMSVSSLAHRFTAETGLAPKRWLTRERLRMARHLLLEGRSVSETAAQVGFATPFHFSRVFTRQEGLPPSQFQRLSRRPR